MPSIEKSMKAVKDAMVNKAAAEFLIPVDGVRKKDHEESVIFRIIVTAMLKDGFPVGDSFWRDLDNYQAKIKLLPVDLLLVFITCLGKYRAKHDQETVVELSKSVLDSCMAFCSHDESDVSLPLIAAVAYFFYRSVCKDDGANYAFYDSYFSRVVSQEGYSFSFVVAAHGSLQMIGALEPSGAVDEEIAAMLGNKKQVADALRKALLDLDFVVYSLVDISNGLFRVPDARFVSLADMVEAATLDDPECFQRKASGRERLRQYPTQTKDVVARRSSVKKVAPSVASGSRKPKSVLEKVVEEVEGSTASKVISKSVSGGSRVSETSSGAGHFAKGFHDKSIIGAKLSESHPPMKKAKIINDEEDKKGDDPSKKRSSFGSKFDPKDVASMLSRNSDSVNSFSWSKGMGRSFVPVKAKSQLTIDDPKFGLYIKKIVADENSYVELNEKICKRRYFQGLFLVPSTVEYREYCENIMAKLTKDDDNSKKLIKLIVADTLAAHVAFGSGISVQGNKNAVEFSELEKSGISVDDVSATATAVYAAEFTIAEKEVIDHGAKLGAISVGVVGLIQAYLNYFRGGSSELHAARVARILPELIIKVIECHGLPRTMDDFRYETNGGRNVFMMEYASVNALVEFIRSDSFNCMDIKTLHVLFADPAVRREFKVTWMGQDDVSLRCPPSGCARFCSAMAIVSTYQDFFKFVPDKVLRKLKRYAADLTDDSNYERLAYASYALSDLGVAQKELPEVPAKILEYAAAFVDCRKDDPECKRYRALNSTTTNAQSLSGLVTFQAKKQVLLYLDAKRSVDNADYAADNEKYITDKVRGNFRRIIDDVLAQEGDMYPEYDELLRGSV